MRLILLCFFLFTLEAIAQQVVPSGVTGNIFSDRGEPLPYASVLLHRAADSVVVKGAPADSSGIFVIQPILPGDYFISADAVGYARATGQIFHLTEKGIVAPLLQLKTGNAITEVDIVAHKPLFERKPGMLVVNVENSLLSEGGTAFETLERSPGVSISPGGAIMLNGRQGVLVLIDGKQQYMNANDLMNLLRTMPAGNIESIELITNPSAKYDAAGTAGIINIKLKKNKKQGFNGTVSLTTSQGRYNKKLGSVNLGYRAGKINTWLIYSYGNYRGFSEYNSMKKYSAGSFASELSEYTFHAAHPNTHNGKAGIEYDISSKQSIGLMASGNFWNETSDDLTIASLFGNSGELYSENSTHSFSKGHYYERSGNLRHTLKTDTLGGQLETNFDFSDYSNDLNTVFFVRTVDAGGNILQPMTYLRNFWNTGIRLYAGKCDFSKPFANGASLETGVKSSFVRTENLLDYDSLGNGWMTDSTKSNEFIYSENIYAAYASWSMPVKKMNLQFGLRSELTQLEGNSPTLDTVFNRSFINLFPSGGLDYRVSGKHQLALSFSRRIVRPSYDLLNPFHYYVNPYTYYTGSPRLRPTYATDIEFSHVFREWLSTSLSVTFAKDEFLYLTSQDDATLITISQPMSLDKAIYSNITVAASRQITKWWTTNTSFSGYYNSFNSDGFLGGDLQSVRKAFVANSGNTFLFGKSLKAELSFFYSSGLTYGTVDLLSRYILSIGIQKTLLSDKMIVKITGADILWTNIQRSQTKYLNQDSWVEQRDDSRVLRFSLQYKIGKGGARRRESGTEEEKQRVKTSR